MPWPWTANELGGLLVAAGLGSPTEHALISGRIVRKAARRAGIAKAVTPHTLRHAFITAALDAAGPVARCPGGRIAR